MNQADSKSRCCAAALVALLALFAGVFETAQAVPQSATDAGTGEQGTIGRWTHAGNLRAGRMGHTATRLPDGRVLVVGGFDGLHQLNSAEIYDPVGRSWSGAGQLSVTRSSHSATLLPDGQVLVAGGYIDSNARSSSAELYDAHTGRWTRTGDLAFGRAEHEAVLMRNGRVLIAGGFNNSPRREDEIYDPATGTWSTIAGLSESRVGHSLTLMADGTVLAAGGTVDFLSMLSTATTELLDPDRGSWTTIAPMGISRTGHAATRLWNGSVLVSGGAELGVGGERFVASSEMYDPSTGSWTAVASLPEPIGLPIANLLEDGRVFVVSSVSPGRSYALDIDRTTWRSTGALGNPRGGHTATLLADGTVLVAGGVAASAGNQVGHLLGTERYEPGFAIGRRITGTWYDPAQPGHGLFIQVLPEGRFLAWWFAFNPDGTQQAWFGGVGTHSGTTATIPQVTQGSGGRWIPNFNPAQVVNNAWGSLSFEFSDLDHGRVDFSSVAGFGSGSMNLTRLTQPAAPGAAGTGASAAVISPAFTGAWYDPAQAGHGLFVEVLPDNRVLAWWFSFDPTGTQQAWFGGVGTYSGNTATITQVVQPTGGRWIPNFNPQQVTNIAWGTLTLTFSDCAHGTAQFSSTRGYGTGTMNLARLTVPAGLACP